MNNLPPYGLSNSDRLNESYSACREDDEFIKIINQESEQLMNELVIKEENDYLLQIEPLDISACTQVIGSDLWERNLSVATYLSIKKEPANEERAHNTCLRANNLSQNILENGSENLESSEKKPFPAYLETNDFCLPSTDDGLVPDAAVNDTDDVVSECTNLSPKDVASLFFTGHVSNSVHGPAMVEVVADDFNIKKLLGNVKNSSVKANDSLESNKIQPKRIQSSSRKRNKDKPRSSPVKPFQCTFCTRKFCLEEYRVNHINKWHIGSEKLETFPCRFCSRVMTNHHTLTQHEEYHVKARSHKCDLCVKSFTSMSALAVHKKTHRNSVQCKICLKLFCSNQSLKKHSYSHSSEMNFECTVCQKKFKSPYNLETHMSLLHADREKYLCNICKKTLSCARALRTHIQNHNTEKIYPCEFCKKMFTTSQYRNNHQSRHTAKFECDLCKKVLATKRNLESHIELIHKRELTYQCDQCDKSFPIKNYLWAHKRSHKNIYNCHLCDAKNFASRQALTSHIKSHHTEKKLKCNICGVRLKTKRTLKSHILSHFRGGRNFKCDKCGKVMSSELTLKNHLISIHGDKKHQCETCQKFYPTKVVLIKHKKLHLKEYTCDICQMALSRRQSMAMHLQVHANENKFKCKICGDSFPVYVYLVKHNRKHVTGINCDVCKKPFFDRKVFLKHMATHTKSSDYFKCKLCDGLYVTKYKLTDHMKRMHP